MWTVEHTETSTATPARLWVHYADPSRWPRWDPDVAAVVLDGPMVTGARGTLTPTTGPTTEITFTEVVPGVGFTDVSRLPLRLATLRFEHHVTATGTGCLFRHRVSITGPLSPLLGRVVGRGIAAGMPGAMRALADLAEAGMSPTR